VIKLFRTWLKKRFGFFDRQDFEDALATAGNAKDREEFEWKLKNRLFNK
jgi:hypothetical protein